MPPPAKPAQKPSVIGLFPTPVMTVPSLCPPELCASILAQARADAKERNAHDQRLAHSAMVRPEDDQRFGRLASLLDPHLTEFGAVLLGERLRWRVKEMWVNVMQAGGRQEMHNHANSFVSVVVYLTDTSAGSRTVFHKALGGGDFAFVNENKATQVSAYNARRWAAPPMRPGDAIFFPSYLLHEAPPHEGPERVTLALNSLPERIDSWGYAVNFG
ncbi:putative 2OG-Fe(II) oxygenase [Rubrimonas cliftonensis]|uniref:Fe2OG dioxygenase domain-containing protein n=1 Tax=Rubrimonas cliftonensis TaxID=89524 RepID=A0A1H3WQZ4_9RHOB|nr:putative 2OG-Fe(II) oxygenase [Rubrimonas cliftonensis]SDZ89370.1 conserved hypothetical protein [Rubrimonas cliftonensis]